MGGSARTQRPKPRQRLGTTAVIRIREQWDRGVPATAIAASEGVSREYVIAVGRRQVRDEPTGKDRRQSHVMGRDR